MTTGSHGDLVIGDTETFVIPPLYATNQESLAVCQPLSSLDKLMYSLRAATGGVLTAKLEQQFKGSVSNEHFPVACGILANEKEANCFHFGPGMSLPAKIAVMREKREGAASTIVMNGTALWITGGMIEGVTDTTLLLSVSSALLSFNQSGDSDIPTLKNGTKLPMAMAYHCLVMVHGDVAILYGGTDMQEETAAISSTWSMEPHGNWIARAPMAYGRYQQGCGVIVTDVTMSGNPNRFVVAAGGFHNQFGEPLSTKSVQLFRVNYDQSLADALWEAGPTLPHTLAGGGSATTSDQSVLFLAGGLVSLDPYLESRAIYSLRCALGTCWWRKDDTELMVQRVSPIALVIPPGDKTALLSGK